MHHNRDIILASAESLQRHFDDDIIASSYVDLKDRLTHTVIKLLLHDMERLLNILYRIDVSEKKVKAVFAGSDPKLIAPAIADLILDRELQKAETRMKYRGGNLT